MYRLLSWLFSSLVCTSISATWLELGQKLDEERQKLIPPGQDPTIIRSKENQIKVALGCSIVNMTLPQHQICVNAEKGFPAAVAKGINAATYVCRRDMKDFPWNCPIPGGPYLFGPVYRAGTRETGYLRALLGAAGTYAMVVACADGAMPWTCGCLSRSKLPPFDNYTHEWGECSHDVRRGIDLACSFIRAGEVETEQTRLNYLSNLHNHDVGTKVARDGVRVVCRCIGGTVSCATKVCHLELADFAYISDELKKKYLSAMKVKLSKNGERLKNEDSTAKAFDKSDLVYGTDGGSPCLVNPEFGYEGVHGRNCSKDRQEGNYCGTLCCGYGYKTYIERKKKSCRCQIKVVEHCCFKLVCDTCFDEIERYRCK